MAPNKLEDRIREQLQERELQPSGEAWEKLEKRLGKTSGKTLNYRVWYAVAAGFAGLLILASIFYNNTPGKDSLVVDEQDEPVQVERIELIEPEQYQEQEIAVSREDDATDLQKDNSQKPQQTKFTAPQELNEIVVEDKQPVIARVETLEKADQLPAAKDPLRIEPVNEEQFIQNKVDEVVAEVGRIQQTGKEIRAEDIDQLLINAQREISKQRILNSPTKKVDAAALLSDVEFELERSFRDKVFNALGEGFNKIRTAMAERNY